MRLPRTRNVDHHRINVRRQDREPLGVRIDGLHPSRSKPLPDQRPQQRITLDDEHAFHAHGGLRARASAGVLS